MPIAAGSTMSRFRRSESPNDRSAPEADAPLSSTRLAQSSEAEQPTSQPLVARTAMQRLPPNGLIGVAAAFAQIADLHALLLQPPRASRLNQCSKLATSDRCAWRAG